MSALLRSLAIRPSVRAPLGAPAQVLGLCKPLNVRLDGRDEGLLPGARRLPPAAVRAYSQSMPDGRGSAARQPGWRPSRRNRVRRNAFMIEGWIVPGHRGIGLHLGLRYGLFGLLEKAVVDRGGQGLQLGEVLEPVRWVSSL